MSFLTYTTRFRGAFKPGPRVKPGRVWLPAGGLHALRLAAGVKSKAPRFPGRIVWTSSAYAAKLRTMANVRTVFG